MTPFPKEQRSQLVKSFFIGLLALLLSSCSIFRDLARVDGVSVEDRNKVSAEGEDGAVRVDFNNCEIKHLLKRARGFALKDAADCEEENKTPSDSSNAPKQDTPEKAATEDTSQRAASSSTSDKEGSMKAARNEIILLLVRASNRNCSVHLAQVHANAAVLNSTLEIFAAGLSGAAAVLTGGVSQGIAAGASVATGTRAILDKEVYQSQIVPAIVREIVENRKQSKDLIYQSLSEPTAKYSVDQGINDAVEFNELCSFYWGLASLVGKAGSKGQPSDIWIEQRRARLEKIRSENDARIESLSKETDDNSKEEVAELRAQNKKLAEQLGTLNQLR